MHPIYQSIVDNEGHHDKSVQYDIPNWCHSNELTRNAHNKDKSQTKKKVIRVIPG